MTETFAAGSALTVTPPAAAAAAEAAWTAQMGSVGQRLPGQMKWALSSKGAPGMQNGK